MKLHRRDILRVASAAALSGCSAPAHDTRPTLPETAAPLQEKAPSMKTRPLFTLRLRTAPTLEIGATPEGKRATYPVIGGDFEGDRLRGKVLPGGADWTLQGPDGAIDLDLRVTLETDDGALIHMTFTGVRNDATSYFRTLPRFETAAPKYAFLNRLLAVGVAEISADGPKHVIEEIL